MANKVKFKPGDKVIISKDSKNIWIQGKKATIIRFLEEGNVPGSFYQWTYEVKLEDGYKCYVPQWEMKLESGKVTQVKTLVQSFCKGRGLQYEPTRYGYNIWEERDFMSSVVVRECIELADSMNLQFYLSLNSQGKACINIYKDSIKTKGYE